MAMVSSHNIMFGTTAISFGGRRSRVRGEHAAAPTCVQSSSILTIHVRSTSQLLIGERHAAPDVPAAVQEARHVRHDVGRHRGLVRQAQPWPATRQRCCRSRVVECRSLTMVSRACTTRPRSGSGPYIYIYIYTFGGKLGKPSVSPIARQK